jgi:hypothetical protein
VNANAVPLCRFPFTSRGYETLSANPPPIRMSLALILVAGNRGFEEVTLKLKVKGMLDRPARFILFPGHGAPVIGEASAKLKEMAEHYTKER